MNRQQTSKGSRDERFFFSLSDEFNFIILQLAVVTSSTACSLSWERGIIKYKHTSHSSSVKVFEPYRFLADASQMTSSLQFYFLLLFFKKPLRDAYCFVVFVLDE